MNSETSRLVTRVSRWALWCLILLAVAAILSWYLRPDLEDLWRDCHDRGGDRMEYHTDTGTYDCYDAQGTRLR